MSRPSTFCPNPVSRSSVRPASDKVGALADDIRELAALTGSATESELIRIGWTPDQLRDLGPAARKRLGPPLGATHG